MIQIRKLALHDKPLVSICCGATPDREYLLNRCWAEMAADLRGLPVDLICGMVKDEEWNESKAKNAAAAQAKPIIIFTNCDATIPRPLLDYLLTGSVFASNLTIVLCLRNDEQADGSLVPNGDAIGEFQAVSKVAWIYADGFDERLTGWGYIDYSFVDRCIDSGARVIRINGVRVKHHWHPRLSDDEYRVMNNRNKEICGV